MKEARNEFINQIRQTAKAKSSCDMAEDWDKLVKSGAIAKIMKQEEEYKKSGGYKELDAEENIEK